jgi:hypothetical protein
VKTYAFLPSRQTYPFAKSLFLLSMYDKSQKESLSDKELDDFLGMAG